MLSKPTDGRRLKPAEPVSRRLSGRSLLGDTFPQLSALDAELIDQPIEFVARALKSGEGVHTSGGC